MNRKHVNQQGVGLIEVMMALAIMMFGALVTSSVQTNAMISMSITDTHFVVNEQSQDMLEILRANKTGAKAGDYNLSFDSVIDPDSTVNPVLLNMAQWLNSIQTELDEGAGQIECDSNRCTVSIRWKENIDGTRADQFYHIAGLL